LLSNNQTNNIKNDKVNIMRYYLDQFILFVKVFFPSIIFNFRYLPFKQAVKLPIWACKPHIHKFKGKVIIDAEHIKTGMIRLGVHGGRMYPNNGFSWTNEGIVIFKGYCMIGNNSFIITGDQGKIVFGDDFIATTSVKIISFCGITFGEHARLGWDSIVMDTNFHPFYNRETEQFKRAFGRISIGDYNWISTQSVVLHSVETPHHCYFGLRSVITRSGDYESYCLYGGSPLRVLSRNVERIIGQDKITDYSLFEN